VGGSGEAHARDIYTGERVNVWLGLESDNSKLAIIFLMIICDAQHLLRINTEFHKMHMNRGSSRALLGSVSEPLESGLG
jgi:hypothetical protein